LHMWKRKSVPGLPISLNYIGKCVFELMANSSRYALPRMTPARDPKQWKKKLI
jgi:hypothetical protein